MVAYEAQHELTIEDLRECFARQGQDHVFADWERLDDARRAARRPLIQKHAAYLLAESKRLAEEAPASGLDGAVLLEPEARRLMLGGRGFSP